MKTALTLLLTATALFATNIEELSFKTKQMDEDRKNTRQVLSMDLDIRESRRSRIAEQRNLQSIVLSKMIQIRDKDRG